MSLIELRILGIVGAVIALYIGYGIWHHKVWQEGYDAHKSEIEMAVKKGEKKYEKDAIEVHRLNNSARRREFCNSVLDADMSTCLKDLAPFRP